MSRTSFSVLRRLARQTGTPSRAQPLTKDQAEYCELCSVRLVPEHRHMLEMATRKIVCSCDACTMTFVPVVEGRFKVIPRDARPLPDFEMSDADWESLALPIDLAFFFYHTPGGKMAALYPSPAGATESLLPLSSWENIVQQNPALRELQPDVEALLVNRARDHRDYFFAPIDKCFELVGLIRLNWRGFTGGEEVWREIDRFFQKFK